jgi:hypothetical protein
MFQRVISFVAAFWMQKIEKYSLRPPDSVTNEWVVSQILVCCINTVHRSVVVYGAFRYELSHINDFTYRRFFIVRSQRQHTLPLSIRINTGSLYRNVSNVSCMY